MSPSIEPKPPQFNYECPSELHQDFHNNWETHVRILCGAYGSGKTFSAAYEILSQLLGNPMYAGKTALVVGQTNHHVKNQLWEQVFLKTLTKRSKRSGKNLGFLEGQNAHYTIEWSPQIKVRFFNGSTILFAVEPPL